MVKRIFDIFGSLIAILIFALPMLIIAILIRLESKGNAIFSQKRAGWRGKAFSMLKFRTMCADVDPYGNSPRTGQDPRLTRFGRWLREKSLDEFPQFFNVLVGQMSLVGPRPLYERQAELWDQKQRHRLDVKPGITGYAQAFGRGDLTIEEKIEFDLYYVENLGFLLDLKIILKTIVNIFSDRSTIYEKRYSRSHDREPGSRGE